MHSYQPAKFSKIRIFLLYTITNSKFCKFCWVIRTQPISVLKIFLLYKGIVQKKKKLQAVSAKYLRNQKDMKIKILLPKKRMLPQKRFEPIAPWAALKINYNVQWPERMIKTNMNCLSRYFYIPKLFIPYSVESSDCLSHYVILSTIQRILYCDLYCNVFLNWMTKQLLSLFKNFGMWTLFYIASVTNV